MSGEGEDNSFPPEEIPPLEMPSDEEAHSSPVEEESPTRMEALADSGAEGHTRIEALNLGTDNFTQIEEFTGAGEIAVTDGLGKSVDTLLSEELLPLEGELPLLDPLPSPAVATPATFHLRFRALSEASRGPLKKASETAGVSVPDTTWTKAAPVVSQLSEYQAVTILQAARALGLAVEAAVSLPSELPTEEDLALGDLASIPDARAIVTESAPSVILPKGEREVLLLTQEQMPGGKILETFGIVAAHRSIARRLFREDDLQDKLRKELRGALPGAQPPGLASSHLQILLRDIMLDLRRFALAKGANSVLGVKIEAFPESNPTDLQLEQLRLVAFGTAAVVEKS